MDNQGSGHEQRAAEFERVAGPRPVFHGKEIDRCELMDAISEIDTTLLKLFEERNDTVTAIAAADEWDRRCRAYIEEAVR